jgi:spore coat protein CotH
MVSHRSRPLAGLVLIAALAGTTYLAHAQTTTPTTPTTPTVVSDPSNDFFDDSIVQSINLEINDRDWQTLKEHADLNDYYPCNFKWGTTTVRNIGIRSRGTGSRSGQKPGLRVDFDRYTSNQTFVGLKSIILRNQTQDPSNMHERIGMQLFKRLGVKTSREAYTKLYIKGVYEGLYTIVESVDKTFLKKSFNENDGYLYKYDYNADDLPYYFEDRGTNIDEYVPHPFKPETRETDPYPSSVADFVHLVATDSDARFPTTVAEFIDWDNFTRHIAVENVISDQDGFNGDYGINNFYFYRLEHSNLFKWIPWDKSEAFKNPSNQTIFRNFLDGDPSKRNRLSARAMTIQSVQVMYLDRLVEAAKSLRELDAKNPADKRGWMEREIEREYAQIRDLVYTDPAKPFTNDQFETEVERLRVWSRERSAFVETAVADWKRSRGLP